jgi:acetoacetyl-CoA synthetase
MSSTHHDSPLYQPPNPEASPTFQFVRRVNAKYQLALGSYSDLYRWSTTQIDYFWGTVWDETDIIGEKGGHVVERTAKPSANPAWFAEAKVNWSENMLRCRSAEKVALVQASAPCLISCAIRFYKTRNRGQPSPSLTRPLLLYGV